MIQQFWEYFIYLIGAGGRDYDQLDVYQVVIRTIVIYAIALLIIRIAKRRFMGGYSSFDILLGFIIGSIMARAIIGGISLINMIIVVGVLTLIHWLIATATYHSQKFSDAVKNTTRKLIIDGEVQEDALLKSKIGKNELLKAIRSEAGLESTDDVKTAYLERDGEITIIPKSPAQRVIEIDVKDGVQTVKIVL